MSTFQRMISDRSSDQGQLSRSEVFELLSNDRRRGVLHFVKRADHERISLDSLVDAIAHWEADGETPSSSIRASVYSSLVQTHLPRLEDAGVLKYHADSGVIEPTERSEELQLYLEYSPEGHIPWAEYYLALGAISAALVAVVWANVPPFDGVPAIVVYAVLTVVLLGSAGVHVVQTQRSRLGSESFEQARERYR